MRAERKSEVKRENQAGKDHCSGCSIDERSRWWHLEGIRITRAREMADRKIETKGGDRVNKLEENQKEIKGKKRRVKGVLICG